MEEHSTNNKINNTQINTNNINNPTSQIKKRTFTESEQNTGSYNVGAKKQKSALSNAMREKALNKLNEINPDIHLESIEQQTLLTANAGQTRKRQKGDSSKVKVIFLGGIGEIGKNITALECGDDMIIIGTTELNFRVRDGNGCDLRVIATSLRLDLALSLLP